MLVHIWVVVAITKMSMRLHSQHTVVRQFRTESIVVNVLAAAVAISGIAALGLLGRGEILLHGRSVVEIVVRSERNNDYKEIA